MATDLGSEEWALYTSEEGWPYWYNAVSGQSTWEDPNAGSAEAEVAVVANEISPALEATEDEDEEDYQEMNNFFRGTCSLSNAAARVAATNALQRKLSTPKKLAKVWNRQGLNLSELGLDEDDAEEVSIALSTILASRQGMSTSHVQNGIQNYSTPAGTDVYGTSHFQPQYNNGNSSMGPAAGGAGAHGYSSSRRSSKQTRQNRAVPSTHTGTFLSRASVARLRQTWQSSPTQRGNFRNLHILFSLCVALCSGLRNLTHTPSLHIKQEQT